MQKNIISNADGSHKITFLNEEKNLINLKHVITRAGILAQPHWHPNFSETFEIKSGKMRFVIDKEEKILSNNESITVLPRQMHEFYNISDQDETLLLIQTTSYSHAKMFELLFKLDKAHKLNKEGIPSNPLYLGLVWEHIDGYIQGPPAIFQTIVFGGLAKLAKFMKYEEKLNLL